MRKRKQNANESNEIVTIDREMAQERYSLGGDSVDKVAKEAGCCYQNREAKTISCQSAGLIHRIISNVSFGDL